MYEIYDMMNNPIACPRDDDVIWQKLESICYDKVQDFPSTKTKYPAVAITNCTQDPMEDPVQTNPPICAAPAGSGIVYDNELLVANHSYSLLGIHEEVIRDFTIPYVILRNPYGTNWGFTMDSVPDWTLKDQGTLDFHVVPPENDPYDVHWDLFVTNAAGARTPNCGVFAMHLTKFKFYFGAFGWVVI
jgi:hypothetical protein